MQKVVFALSLWIVGSVLSPALTLAQPVAQSQGVAGNPVTSMIAILALTLLPFAFMICTSFVKISVVLSILRNALGTGQVPSGMVITALSALLSLYVMAPVGGRISDAIAESAPELTLSDALQAGEIDALFAAYDAGKEPLLDFLERHAHERELTLFLELAQHADEEGGTPEAEQASPRDLRVLLPAFLISELAEAFQIGFLVFIPFLVVDMVVANVLLALGMHMLSPTTVSLPFKLLLFVLADGWFLLAQGLISGYF